MPIFRVNANRTEYYTASLIIEAANEEEAIEIFWDEVDDEWVYGDSDSNLDDVEQVDDQGQAVPPVQSPDIFNYYTE